MIRLRKDKSRAQSSHIAIPVPQGLELRPFQKAGVEYALDRPNTLIADEMGLGKSCQSICVSNCIPEIRKVLIICPASVKIMWQREWQRFDVKGLSVGIAGKTFPDADVCIINYDILKKYRGELRRSLFDLMITDECHMLKSGKADRTKEVFGGIKRGPDKRIAERITPIPAARRLFLSGTPMLNGKPKEMWNLIKAIDPQGLGADWFAFAKRYCGLFEIERFDSVQSKKVHQGWKWDSAENLEELQTLMRQRFMIRRLKQDVLTELPPKIRQIITLTPKKDLTKLLEREILSYDNFVKEHGGEIDPPAFTEMAKIRKETALAKVSYVVDYLQELLDETTKIVVAVHHHEVGDAIAKAFGSEAVLVDGRVSTEDRQRRIDRFQTDPTCRLFIGGIQAAGTGITLTKASIVVFAELDFVPANISQFEDRLHRIGQRDSVLVYHIVLEKSLDERIVKILVKKQEISDRALDTIKM